MQWHKTDIDKEIVRSLSERFQIDLLTAAVLARRGITGAEEIKFYLEREMIFTHNPFLFDEMDEAVGRIRGAADEGERVLIFGDRDVDGITSTVLLREALIEMGLEVEWLLPQGDEPYGITMEAVEAFAERGGTLIITVDSGISNNREILRARELGIDTVVVDHHLPLEELPPAAAIINPKLADSSYPFRDLSGCGVAAKLAWALEFSKTDFFNEELVLLNARPGNDTVILEAVKMVNLVETDRIVENFVPAMVRPDQTRLASFLLNTQILVYDRQQNVRLLKRVFGAETEINVYDVAPEIGKVFPVLEGKSLLKIRDKSRTNRYLDKTADEIDIFVSLFTSYVRKRYPALSTEFDKKLDLVALGTLADLMPLVDENRILVNKGMERINSVKREALHELLLQQNLLGKQLGTTDVSWQISPLINATGRLGVPDKAAQMFITEDTEERRKLVTELIGLNKERKKLGDAAWTSVLPLAQRSFEELQERMVLVSDEQVHRGVTGIIAARLTQYYSVPAAVVARIEDHLVGSMRSAGAFPVKNFLSHFEDLFIDYGGHDFAAGFSLPFESYAEFEKRFKQEVQELEEIQRVEKPIAVDAELPANYLTPELHSLVERLEPYGEEHPPLIFLAKGLLIENLDLVGKGEQQLHVKMLLNSGKFKWPAIFWKAGDRVNRDFSLGDNVDVVFRLGRNYFQYTETSQLTILDIRRSED
jgi:single-stranded-DNA-specific exonuclease